MKVAKHLRVMSIVLEDADYRLRLERPEWRISGLIRHERDSEPRSRVLCVIVLYKETSCRAIVNSDKVHTCTIA